MNIHEEFCRVAKMANRKMWKKAIKVAEVNRNETRADYASKDTIRQDVAIPHINVINFIGWIIDFHPMFVADKGSITIDPAQNNVFDIAHPAGYNTKTLIYLKQNQSAEEAFREVFDNIERLIGQVDLIEVVNAAEIKAKKIRNEKIRAAKEAADAEYAQVIKNLSTKTLKM